EEEHLDALQIAPRCGVGEEQYLARAPLEVLLAQLRREDDRGRGGVLVAHQALPPGAADLAPVRLVAQQLDGPGRPPPPAVVHHRHHELRTIPGVVERLSDDRDDDDRHQQREGERRAVAQEDAQVLAEDGEHGRHEPSPGGAATLARRRSSNPWNESFATAASNWAR